MGTAYVVASGKGGTGKTSLVAGVGAALAAAGHRTLCIDADIGLRNLDIVLGMTDRVLMNFADVIEGRCTLERRQRSTLSSSSSICSLRPCPSPRAKSRPSRCAPCSKKCGNSLPSDFWTHRRASVPASVFPPAAQTEPLSSPPPIPPPCATHSGP